MKFPRFYSVHPSGGGGGEGDLENKRIFHSFRKQSFFKVYTVMPILVSSCWLIQCCFVVISAFAHHGGTSQPMRDHQYARAGILIGQRKIYIAGVLTQGNSGTWNQSAMPMKDQYAGASILNFSLAGRINFAYMYVLTQGNFGTWEQSANERPVHWSSHSYWLADLI